MDNEAASEAKRPRLEDGDTSPAAVDDAKRGFRVQATGSAGTLLFSGGTNWDTIGRRPKDKQKAGASQERNLWGPPPAGLATSSEGRLLGLLGLPHCAAHRAGTGLHLG
ncbi:hypothetical protein MTO96_026665 [Rhipicephalus appendiculatus]